MFLKQQREAHTSVVDNTFKQKQNNTKYGINESTNKIKPFFLKMRIEFCIDKGNKIANQVQSIQKEKKGVRNEK